MLCGLRLCSALYSRPEFVSDLLPDSDGLFLGLAGDSVLAGTAPPIGAVLTAPSAKVRFYDANTNGIWDVDEPAIYDVDDDYIYTAGVDTVLVGTAPPNLSPLTDPNLPWDCFYDANLNGVWDVGEPAVRDVDGDYLYKTVRRWNLLLKRIASGQEPTLPRTGHIWFYDVDGHIYLGREDLGSYLKIPLDGDAQPPTIHGNPNHSLAYTDIVFLSGPYLAAADVTVGSAASVTLATVNFTPTGTRQEYIFPMAGFNFRPDAGNTANRRLDVWLEDAAGTQRSAKFPITVVLADPKRPFTFNLAFHNSLDIGFWQAPKISSTTITLKGQMDVETALCSDRFLTLLRFSRQP